MRLILQIDVWSQAICWPKDGTKNWAAIVGENIVVTIETARGPESLMIPIPPRPPGVAIAAIVELSIIIVIAVVAFAC